MNRETAVTELRRRIKSFLRGELEYPQFELEYVNFFADSNADAEFQDRDHELYGELFERLQWTAQNPPGLDRATGYHTAAETTEWVRARFPELT